LLGVAGLTTNQCEKVVVEEQIISEALIGGGNVEYYFSENGLEGSRVIEIIGTGLNFPKTLEELQDNYMMIEDNKLTVRIQ
jgi:hypothetical protein